MTTAGAAFPANALPLRTLDDTLDLARTALQALPAGALLLLSGPLGAGKTTFTQALGKALRVVAPVTSPTYTLVHEYPSPGGTLVHLDAYRLGSAEPLAGSMLDDYLERARLVVVEWGEQLLAAYPEAWWLEFGFLDQPDGAGDEGNRLRYARWRVTHPT